MNTRTVRAETLFVSSDRVLLVHRSIDEHGWDIPGVVVGDGESPAVAASRELGDDLGLDLFVRRLLVVDWASVGTHDEMLLIFDGGAVRDVEVRPALGRNGLDRWEWVPVDQLAGYLPDISARRLVRALKARADCRTLYLEHGETT